jgi:hypothetical protein
MASFRLALSLASFPTPVTVAIERAIRKLAAVRRDAK